MRDRADRSLSLIFNRRAHPSRETLESFLRGALEDPEQDRRVERHLSDGCGQCLFRARELALQLTESSRRSLRQGLFDERDRPELLDSYGVWVTRKVLLIETP